MINRQRALTIYKNKDDYINRLKKSTNIQANKPRMSEISKGARTSSNRLKLKQATTATHFLKSQVQTSSAKLQQSSTVTHQLKNQGQMSLTGQIAARHHSHSQTGEPRAGIISRLEQRLELQQGTTATYFLKNQGHTLLAGQIQ